ncbi:MAG TPA: peptide chain release factor 2 [Candidatus Fraserbacteria bacterium]|nr:peptide chain release factor 2 [Candidatus Fraserbacteria bacterium]
MIAFDLAQLEKDLQALEAQMSRPGFWEDRQQAKRVAQAVETKRSALSGYKKLADRLDDLEVLAELGEQESDENALREVEEQGARLAQTIDRLELQTVLDGEYDRNDCYLSVNAGAGGTDAQDWAEMLLRMYLRWFEARGYRAQLVEASPGEVAGIKSATVEVKGLYAYGYLQGEQGVHRLVRISPFDANRRRHTSFAAVAVIPQVQETDVEIRDEELKIDTYRASGAGGQHVNKTDSAVRITHRPTGIVVASQQERSQHQNKEIALRILKARLHALQRQAQQEELSQVRGELKRIEWGSQIRSYVFQPYQLVKDHRTGVEVGNIESVMAGNLDPFIEGYLRRAGHG